MIIRQALLVGMLLAISSCARTPHAPSVGHLGNHLQIASPHSDNIPATVSQTSVVPEPVPAIPEESFDVVVTDVSLDKLLFALARDASINIDIHPGLSGQISLNAIDQTLLQILNRIAAQVPIRYSFEENLLVVEPDHPYLKTYSIDYVNLQRSVSSSSNVSTQIASSGNSAIGESGGSSSGSNNSETSVISTSENQFWKQLRTNLTSMLELGAVSNNEDTNHSVITSPETGLISVRATDAQHRMVQEYLDRTVESAQRQVLIEATIVEVELNDNYQFGVDWSVLASNATGLSFTQSLLGNSFANSPVSTLSYATNSNTWGQINSTVQMLQEFGNVKVLSSPKIMAINNQTALLKVVDNLVYFTIAADTVATDNTAITTFTTTPHTVPVGFVMSVTPQISREQAVILNVRPTISRVTSFVNDPNPDLAIAKVVSRIPQIQVREMETVMRVRSGQLSVLGGLIQDSVDLNDQGIPGVMQAELLGDAFTYRKNQIKKSELVVFLRPRVVSSLDQSLGVYQNLLPDPGKPMTPFRANDRSAWN